MNNDEINPDTMESLQDFLSGDDGIHETISNAIDRYFECNPEDAPPEEAIYRINWNITIGEDQ